VTYEEFYAKWLQTYYGERYIEAIYKDLGELRKNGSGAEVPTPHADAEPASAASGPPAPPRRARGEDSTR
jgi:hypothetical protein